MKKSHIRVLVVVMSAALIGLVAFQWVWVKNAVALREKQFRFRVKSAMETVVEQLQDREISFAVASGQVLGVQFFPHLATPPACFPGPNGSHPESPGRYVRDTLPTRVFKRQVSTRRRVNGNWISEQAIETTFINGDSQVVVQQRGNWDDESMAYVQTIVERMLHGSMPIHQRLKPAVIDTLLRMELRRREIEEPYVFAISREGMVPAFFQQNPQVSEIDHEKDYFRVLLFPHDIRPTEHYLELQFPNHQSTTMRAMHVVLPTSGLLVLVVMGCFGITLIAFRRQQKLSALKTDFINNMTHELKTPISTISLALEVLNDPEMQTQERIGQYARVIGQENDRLKTQVERVLQAAAMERGELKLDMQPLDLDVLVREQIERIRLHVEGRGGQIRYALEAADTTVMADHVHLGGVVFNLLDNANKYSPRQPTISVRTLNMANGIWVQIQDQGLGISPEAQRRVFEKFYRVPTGNVHDVKGFGIGLSYALSMARAHGGDISLESEVGKGSTFTLFIPQSHLTQ